MNPDGMRTLERQTFWQLAKYAKLCFDFLLAPKSERLIRKAEFLAVSKAIFLLPSGSKE